MNILITGDEIQGHLPFQTLGDALAPVLAKIKKGVLYVQGESKLPYRFAAEFWASRNGFQVMAAFGYSIMKSPDLLELVDAVVAFHDGKEKGTRQLVKRARALGKKVKVLPALKGETDAHNSGGGRRRGGKSGKK